MTTTVSTRARPATFTGVRRPTPARDVVVAGTAGPAYAITDLLRDADLSVGSSLHPYGGHPGRCRAQVEDALEDPELTASWTAAEVIVTLWQDPLHHTVACPLQERLPYARWLHLGSTSVGGRDPVHAPVTVETHTDRCFLGPGARAVLAREATRGDPTRPWHLTVSALLGLPRCGTAS